MAMRASNRRTSSSSTKTAPAIGALNAVASPARTSREQHLPVRPAAATDPSYQISDRRSHLHAGALSAECQPGADRQQSAKKLHRDQLGRRRRQLAGQHGLDMWNAASRSRGRKATDEPRRNSDSASTCGDNE